MSDGRTHLVANLLLTGRRCGGPGILQTSAGSLQTAQLTALMAGMLVGSLWLTPNLDSSSDGPRADGLESPGDQQPAAHGKKASG